MIVICGQTPHLSVFCRSHIFEQLLPGPLGPRSQVSAARCLQHDPVRSCDAEFCADSRCQNWRCAQHVHHGNTFLERAPEIWHTHSHVQRPLPPQTQVRNKLPQHSLAGHQFANEYTTRRRCAQTRSQATSWSHFRPHPRGCTD